jgi:hypothetical protein
MLGATTRYVVLRDGNKSVSLTTGAGSRLSHRLLVEEVAIPEPTTEFYSLL